MIHNVIIIGSGPAGLTAGIYLGRAKLNPILIEGIQPGGQLTTTSKVENWPSITSIMGRQLMIDIKKHTQYSGCNIISDIVISVDFSNKPYKIITKKGKIFETKSVIIATGTSNKKLEGEDKYWSKGVSACAIYDAQIFQDKNVVVVGGGNSAVTEAEYLSHFAKKVIIIQILDKLTATDTVKDKVINNSKIKIFYNSIIEKIDGDGKQVTKVIIKNKKNNQSKTLNTDGVFISIGMQPNTEFLKEYIELDPYGYIILKNKTLTSKEGIFAAGDIHNNAYKQAITASSSGCMAAIDCQKYLINIKKLNQ